MSAARRFAARALRAIKLAFPLWVPLVATAVLPLVSFRRRVRARRRRRAGRCVTGGYDLRGSLDRCPECGAIRPVDADARANIPPLAQPPLTPAVAGCDNSNRRCPAR